MKNSFLREDIEKQIQALMTVGTEQQKAQEREVISYRKKINDFANLLQNHSFSSNVFAFMQRQTLPNIWFRQFSLNGKSASVQLSGESEDMDALSRQVAVFEKNKYVQNLGTLTSSLGGTARTDFTVNLALNKNIFDYLSIEPLEVEIVAAPEENVADVAVAESGDSATASNETAADGSSAQQPKSDAKYMLSFRLPLNPEVTGAIDQSNYRVALNVPPGANIKNLRPSILLSPGATVSPLPDVAQDFTSPITYTVTAQDGSTQQYVVRTVVSPVSQTEAESGKGPLSIIAVIAVLLAAAALAGGLVFLILKKKKQAKNNFQ